MSKASEWAETIKQQPRFKGSLGFLAWVGDMQSLYMNDFPCPSYEVLDFARWIIDTYSEGEGVKDE